MITATPGGVSVACYPAAVWIGLVLAGGRSRRMGADKAALDIGGRTLLEWAVERVRRAGGEPLVLGPPRDAAAVT